MEIVDSQADLDYRWRQDDRETTWPGRARGADFGRKVIEIQPLPNWARPRGAGPNAALRRRRARALRRDPAQRRRDVGALTQSLSACVGSAPDPLAAAAVSSATVMSFCAEASAVDAEILALWIADVALASRLGWGRPVALLAVAILRPLLRRGAGGRRPRPFDEDWVATVASAYGLAAVEAHALAIDLSRRAMRLATVAPKLRARGAARVVDMLLADDGVTPSAAAVRVKVSDRAARRLFERLVSLGAARELTGRDSFRIYGL